jgi:hypothetical protein
MHQINLLDETFDKNQSLHYTLAIQYTLNGLSFCLLDSVRSKYIAFRHYAEIKSIDDVIQSDDLLKLQYKTTCLLIDEGKNTLVPLPFFEEGKAGDIYRFNLGGDPLPQILFDKLEESQVANVYPCSQSILAKFKSLFPGLKVWHRSSPFIEHLVLESIRLTRLKCHVSVHQGMIDIGMAQSKKLEYFNTFAYSENTDIVYHILNILEQFKLSAASADIHLSVDLERHEDVFNYLQNYLHHVKFIKPSEKYTYSYIFDEFQLTRFANLFNTALCV